MSLHGYSDDVDATHITPDPEQLKALSHPMRLQMLGLLRTEGPATATALAERLGLNTGATSYHLRQLARHGFIADEPTRGTGRERWWRAAHQATRAPMGDGDDATRARSAFWQAVAVVHTDTLQHAVEEHDALPQSWREASTLSDWMLRLTPRRARALLNAIAAAVADADDEVEGDESEDVMPYCVMLHAFPQPHVAGRRES